MTADKTTDTPTIDLDAMLDAWIADAIADAGSTGGRNKGNAEAQCLTLLETFSQSTDAVLKIDANVASSWTFTRKGSDPDGFRSMREVSNVVRKMADTMPDAPIYVVTFTSDDDEVTVLNTGVAAAEALDAHKLVVQRALGALQRARRAQKALGPNASASHQRAASDRVNKAQAKMTNATADAKRLLASSIA